MARPTGGYSPPDKSVARLVDQLTATLREYFDQGATRTDLVRAASEDVVSLRGMYTRNDAPDWQGRSHDYRKAIGEVFSRLQLEESQRKKVQSLIGFHVGNLLRERLDSDDLEAAGLLETSPADRFTQFRTVKAAAAAAAGATDGGSESLPKVLAWAATLVEQGERLTADPLTKVERSAVNALISDVRKGLDAIEAAL